MTYRSDLDALEARHAALEAEATQKAAERDRARELLDEAKARMRLPVLDNVRVASPCTAAWDAMTGDDHVRHCAICDKDVFNLSDMTRPEAEALIAEANGKLCVRYYRRADGTILTADCPVGERRVRRRKLVVAGAAVLLAATAASYELANEPTQGSIASPHAIAPVPPVAKMGGLASPTPPSTPVVSAPPSTLEMGQMISIDTK